MYLNLYFREEDEEIATEQELLAPLDIFVAFELMKIAREKQSYLFNLDSIRQILKERGINLILNRARSVVVRLRKEYLVKIQDVRDFNIDFELQQEEFQRVFGLLNLDKISDDSLLEDSLLSNILHVACSALSRATDNSINAKNVHLALT